MLSRLKLTVFVTIGGCLIKVLIILIVTENSIIWRWQKLREAIFLLGGLDERSWRQLTCDLEDLFLPGRYRLAVMRRCPLLGYIML